MKKVFQLPSYSTLFLVLSALCTSKSFGQISTPTAYNSGITVNYIRTWEACSPQTNADTLVAKALKDVKQATQYFDGLGRPLQTVIKKGSLVTGDTAKDFVYVNNYDEFGLEKHKYLPFAANSTGGNTSISNGLFKLNPFQQDSAFNKLQFGGESFYYSQTSFEMSPISRVQETFAPGDSWVGTANQNNESDRHSIKMKYWVNTTADSVRVWTVTNVTGNFGTYATSSIYSPGELYKNVTADENNKQVIEFKDKSGNLILKKVQLTATADTGTGKNHLGWLCTYYIYDVLNHLRCVLQPKATEAITSSWSLSSTILNELCFRYEYDIMGRVHVKKMPGAGAIFMEYDGRNRLISMQDSVMRQNHRIINIYYDDFNRQIETVLSNDQGYLSPVEELTKTFYDDYSWLTDEGNPLSDSRITTYDSYLLTASNTSWPYPQLNTQTDQTKGLVTGSKTKVLGTADTYLYSIVFYDEKNRPIQVVSTNISGGVDVVTTQYSFNGQPLVIINKMEKAGSNSQTNVVLTRLTYDDLGRVTKTEKKISNTLLNSGNMPSNWETISQNNYNAIGLVSRKIIGNNLDSLKYDYNIRKWLTGVNKEYIKDSINAHWFGFELGYDKTNSSISNTSYSTQQYNGNISGTIWKAGGDQEKRKYDFTYDYVNRLIKANFNQKFGSSWVKTDPNNSNFTIDYSLDSMSYDANGNILFMQQKGLKINASSVVDKMTYGYGAGGISNKLLSVTEDSAIGSTNNKLGDFTDLFRGDGNGDNDYSYDGNGNLIADKNKRIDSIYYNHLNLPRRIRMSDSSNALKGIIEYTYDAGGNKLEKKTTEGSKVTTTRYIGGFMYQNDTLQFGSQEEGRIRLAKKYFLNGDSAYKLFYDYFLKDHLGNVRVVLTEQKDTVKYMATIETALRTKENALFMNIDSCATAISGITDYPSDPTTSPNNYTARTNGDDLQTGPGIALKVMAGDKFDIAVNSFYVPPPGHNPIQYYNNTGSVFSYLLSVMSNGISAASGTKVTPSQLASSGSPMYSAVQNFLNNVDSLSNASNYYPYAYINWILLDEQFKYIPAGSGFERVSVPNALETKAFFDLPVTKNGYLFVFVSNSTYGVDVYFDNLVVQHYTSPLIEETHYYPFGLSMSAISSTVAGKISNKTLYNSKERQDGEMNDGSGLDYYDFGARMMDPQIGRWWIPDPMVENMKQWSPYTYCFDNPVNLMDKDGMVPGPGDHFTSADEAAHDWALTYGQYGIDHNVELASTIFKCSDGKGGTYYTYNEPTSYGSGHANFRENPRKPVEDPKAVRVGIIHNHGAWDDAHYNNIFSSRKTSADHEPGDIETLNERNCNGYLVTTNGSLLKYDLKTQIVTKLPYDDIPFDREDPTSPTTVDGDPPPGHKNKNLRNWFDDKRDERNEPKKTQPKKPRDDPESMIIGGAGPADAIYKNWNILF